MSGSKSNTEVFTVGEVGEEVEEVEGARNDNNRCMYEMYVQPCLAELFGTSLFVFVGCASVIGNNGSNGVLQPALAHGLTLGVLIMVFGQISGGHFNPAVSLSVYMCGGMELLLTVPYLAAQILGGMIGAALTKVMYPAELYDFALGGVIQPGTSDLGKAMMAETMLTLILTTVVCLGAVNNQTRSPSAPFCIGLTVTANIIAGGMLSGACMNPARAFGPAVVANQWAHHWLYWVGPICGALLTVTFVRLFFGDQRTRVLLK
ncbi:aquaporin-8-like [Hippoglossus stenolepis]|uniref:aquaporin-8-like n=1 Tax=Hippoglossus stenolepis TaxID=195615 RepID=UPI00159BF620|nr:aquaporin-8-like [Hippoglossus stenolepis]